jgi:hypothetical protein
MCLPLPGSLLTLTDLPCPFGLERKRHSRRLRPLKAACLRCPQRVSGRACPAPFRSRHGTSRQPWMIESGGGCAVSERQTYSSRLKKRRICSGAIPHVNRARTVTTPTNQACTLWLARWQTRMHRPRQRATAMP